MANILICDDEPHITRAVEIKLKRAGHEVEPHCDGRAAWDALLDRIADGVPMPDLLITDCQMPRMTGLQLAAAIQAEPRMAGLPVIMLTAKGFELSADELSEKLGIAKLVGKPFSPRDLSGLVDELLSARRGEDAAPNADPAADPAADLAADPMVTP